MDFLLASSKQTFYCEVADDCWDRKAVENMFITEQTNKAYLETVSKIQKYYYCLPHYVS